MMEAFEFLTQTQLGEVFGVSAIEMGRWLIQDGLRVGKMPTERAIKEGLAKFVVTEGDRGFWSWHRDKTPAFLESVGRKRVDGAPGPKIEPPPLPLIGPFTLQHQGGNDYALVGSNGSCVRVRGETNARRLQTLLDLGHRHGKLGDGP